MRRVGTITVFAFCTLLCASIILAQQTSIATTTTTSVPNLIRYSGTLKDAQGAAFAFSTPVGVTFALYNQQDGGAAVWQETQNVTADSNGQYSVILGSTTATGLPDDLFSQQEQRWLGVQVQGQEEQARVLLVSVPYAFKAHEADTLGGLPASAFIQAAPMSASGGTTIDSGTAVNAVATAANSGSTSNRRGVPSKLSAACNANSPGYIAYWNSSGVLCASNLFQNLTTGNIGIGTMLPSTALDVNGAINASPKPSATGSNSGNYQILENPVLSIGWPSQFAIAANQNTLVGMLAGAQGFVQNPGTGNTGTGETFVGYNAGFHNQTGSANTALGVLAGYRNVNGNGNTSVGFDAAFGVFGETVNNNTIVGYQAGVNNNASNVSFYGYQAGANNTANSNSFFGFSAGTANTSGNSNTFLGNMAGTANTAGSGDTFVGDSAGAANVTNNYNTFMGQYAGLANTANDNSFYGFAAGISNTIGPDNVFIGYQSGFFSTTSGGNVFAGSGAGYSNTIGPDNVFIGFQAGYNFNDPLSENTFVGAQAGYSDSSGYYNTDVGFQAGYDNTTGNENTYLGYAAGFNSSGTNNIGIGYEAGGAIYTGNGNIDIGNLGVLNESNTTRIGGGFLATTATYIAGIYPPSSVAMASADYVVCVNPSGGLYGAAPTTPNTCAASLPAKELLKQHMVVAAQQDVIKTQQEQIQTQGQQIADLQERLSRLEVLIANK
jgi:hypothetical protein